MDLRSKAFQKLVQLIVRGTSMLLPIDQAGAGKASRAVMAACRGHRRVVTSELPEVGPPVGRATHAKVAHRRTGVPIV